MGGDARRAEEHREPRGEHDGAAARVQSARWAETSTAYVLDGADEALLIDERGARVGMGEEAEEGVRASSSQCPGHAEH